MLALTEADGKRKAVKEEGRIWHDGSGISI
jgi:hypothetical protein